MQILENPMEPFATACKLAGIPPCTRQWRKWKQGRGIAREFLPAVPYWEPFQVAKRFYLAATERATEARVALAQAADEDKPGIAEQLLSLELMEAATLGVYQKAEQEYKDRLPTVRFN